ncbi:MAG: lipopolysaccharide biosynthesis protein [Bacteroidetes bacterium]|nr:lipopolysaccharide biosynthesis protein [Bacteroidota bacterium]
MSTIRRQSIISSAIVYLGFALGTINTLVFARLLTTDQYGLVTGMFVSIGNIMFSIANLGMPSFITKFYPYYKNNLTRKTNDMMSLVIVVTLVGFLLVVITGLVFKPLVIQKFGKNSALLVQYYYWVFPFGLGLSLFTVLESYGWQLHRSILTSYLREFEWRLLNLILIGFLFFGVLRGFDSFVKFYSCIYLLITAHFVVVLVRKGELHFTFSISKVTRKFLPKIRSLVTLAWTGTVMFNISFYFAQVVIAAVVPGGLTSVAVFTMGQFIASFVMAPQRAVSAAAVGHLSQAWRDKDLARIGRIYRRSSINQLVFAIGIFVLIWLNFRDFMITFGLSKFVGAEIIFLIVGLNRVIDMGTGLNTQILGTSVYWRFDFFTGMILVALTVPLNYLLAKHYGIIGPAIADILTFSLYNGFRCIFLYRRFGMQPFDKRTIYSILLGTAVAAVAWFTFHERQGLLWLVLRSLTVMGLYGAGVLILRLSEDVAPIWTTIKKRLGAR